MGGGSVQTLLRNITNWSIMADFQNLYHFNVTKTLQNGSRFCKTLVTRYNLPNYKVSGQLKSHNRFLDMSAIMDQSACCYAKRH